MQIISGKQSYEITAPELAAWAANYQSTLLDLGTGDGRFVVNVAKHHPELGVIGVDLNAANLRRASRTASRNALFAVADGLALPDALTGVATRVTINFPWGSLLRGLLHGDPALIAALRRVACDSATLDIRVNAGAFIEEGLTASEGSRRMTAALEGSGITIRRSSVLGPAELRSWPTTWSKRLAFGRDPRAVQITAELSRCHTVVPVTAGIDGRSRLLSVPAGTAAA